MKSWVGSHAKRVSGSQSKLRVGGKMHVLHSNDSFQLNLGDIY